MAGDARLLLRTAANERVRAAASGISDPFASYSSSGNLRCSACDYLTIKPESLWGAHVLSKSHRANAARIKQEDQLRQAEQQRTKDGKRKAEDADGDAQADSLATSTDADLDQQHSALASKKARTDVSDAAPAVDAEWELFKSQMESTEIEPDPSTIPSSAGAALEAEAQLITNDNAKDGSDGIEDKSPEELAAEERARKEQEEREEIFSRVEEEQRLQDEADQRVTALKERLQRIKQVRLDRQKANKKA
ncbi:hypothetical protein PHSY_000711 [Pseudozyma hubeiensis SY62]|uniref:Zinc finger protein 830 n=1 Tax=Pseudozyma hubeiensis (strain SY62) TaxID=1305764 RepID=R9NWY7_PSEHS|nr:hypothetical protein PHSY_000711 [Pseudozyma hubeiensis SY62]GAC93148.1 hypothetical protein PHSY_000711 [Pseudozyma hubeiensis SY62]